MGVFEPILYCDSKYTRFFHMNVRISKLFLVVLNLL